MSIPKELTQLEELKLIKQQVEYVIDLIETGCTFTLTEQEEIEHERIFGAGSITTEDYVITRRKDKEKEFLLQPDPIE